jgi:hypothetical protein
MGRNVLDKGQRQAPADMMKSETRGARGRTRNPWPLALVLLVLARVLILEAQERVCTALRPLPTLSR